jgi:hypothetical protein
MKLPKLRSDCMRNQYQTEIVVAGISIPDPVLPLFLLNEEE